MNFSSSLLPALIGGVWVALDPPPPLNANGRVKVTPSVAIASCNSFSQRFERNVNVKASLEEAYPVSTNLPAGNTVCCNSSHLEEVEVE